MLNDVGGLSCRTRTSAPTATLRPNRPAHEGCVPARDGYANELVAFLRRGGHGATSIYWQRSARTCQARCVSYRATSSGAEHRRGRLFKVPWIILPGFIDLHDHLTWNIQPRWLTGRNLTIAKNGRIRGIGLLAEQSALPGNPDFFLRSGDVRGDQGACQWGDLGPRGLLSSDKSSANHPCVRDLPEIWIGGAGFSQSNRSPTGLAPGSLNLHAPNPLALAAERASVQDNSSQNGSKETAL